MLVLTRKAGEEIVIDGRMRICVVQIRGNRVRIGIEAPEDVRIQRQELAFRPEREPAAASGQGCLR